jgi:alanine racemase
MIRMNRESMPEPSPRAWIDVDLGALLRNARMAVERSGRRLIPMVKADAYGLGAIEVANALEALDPFAYGVAAIAEGQQLRAAGIDRQILVFTPTLASALDEVARARLTPALSEPESIRAWMALGGGAWHLAIDTGMNRAGVRWDEVGALADLLRESPPEGAFTHFHSAELDDGSLERQEARFAEALARLPARPRVVHSENSAAIMRRSPSAWDVVRPGVFLYGVGGGEGAARQPESVASLRARVVEVREVKAGETVSYDATWTARCDSRIATLACGYADGYRRDLGNRGRVLIRGAERRVAGVVTMDMTMVDVTDAGCAVGDVATLLGTDGSKTLSPEHVAGQAGLSPYELLTGLSRPRLPRFYADSAR